MYPATLIAWWFAGWSVRSEASEPVLPNPRLQGLLYLAQGHHLAAGAGPLFPEELHAWRCGPVVPSVDREYRAYVGRQFRSYLETPFREIDPGTQGFLRRVWDGYAARALDDLTRDDGPWAETYREVPYVGIIPTERLRAWFERHPLGA